MYRLLSIEESAATRNLELKNLKTGTIEWCFDDSAVTSSKNFDFMEINEAYNCRIYLLGELNDTGENLKYIKDVVIGNRDLSEVVNEEGDVYYINRIPGSEFSSIGKMLNYNYTRKDIVQVNNIVHSDFK
ncbi:hypothetical protein [Enterococcus sp. AZ192]|uniref:hypothetical protein n=1 Tax=unclassified Enterococcus TaxID=2608891 RepID=UPI003D2A0829